MSKNHKRYGLISLLLLLLLAAFLGYRSYQYEAFKRAYEQESPYKQLETLMLSERYAKAVKKAGYAIDNYLLKMNGRIVALETKGNPVVHVEAPDSGLIVRFQTTVAGDTVQIFMMLTPELTLKHLSAEKMLDTGSTEKIILPADEEQKLVVLVKQKLETMLKDLYQSIYD